MDPRRRDNAFSDQQREVLNHVLGGLVGFFHTYCSANEVAHSLAAVPLLSSLNFVGSLCSQIGLILWPRRIAFRLIYHVYLLLKKKKESTIIYITSM